MGVFSPIISSNTFTGRTLAPTDRLCAWCETNHSVNDETMLGSENGSPVFHNDKLCIIPHSLLDSNSILASLAFILIFLNWTCFTEFGSSSSSVT